MKKTMAIAMLALALPAAGDSLGIKPGLWDLTTTKRTLDGHDLSGMTSAMQQAMAALPPERRAQIEAMTKGRLSDAISNNMSLCISPAMASADRPVLDPSGRCQPATVTRHGNKMSFAVSCASKDGQANGKGESVINGDTVTTVMDMTTSDAQGTHVLHTESQMVWRGADCGSVKPLDQQTQPQHP